MTRTPADANAAHPFGGGECFMSARRVVTVAAGADSIASDWQTLALTLELAGPLCLRDGRAIEGSCLVEMHWWGQVRAGDSLQVHARPVDGWREPGRDKRKKASQAILLWTVNQAGRCVFSCLALVDAP